jgi:hypothetical protein
MADSNWASHLSLLQLRDRVRMLALQKRMMEISVQPQTMYRIGDVIVHKKYGEGQSGAFLKILDCWFRLSCRLGSFQIK